MTSIKLKFRPSSVDGKEGSIYYQIIHNRKVRQLHTDYRILPEEWDETEENIIIRGYNSDRVNLLTNIRERINWDISRMKRALSQIEAKQDSYTVEEVIELFSKQTVERSFFDFMNGVIMQLRQLRKVRTSETYFSTLRSFMTFLRGQDIPIDGITSDLMLQYESWLKLKGVCMNSISFYMRILRAVFNRAVDKGMVEQTSPFRHVYTGIDKTIKRAIPIKSIKSLKNMDLTMRHSSDFARDMFMFSFYTRGMSFIDMAYLKKKDLSHGILTYRRRKTGQLLSIKWEKCMAEIVNKYNDDTSEYLLPIIKRTGDERRQYINSLHLVNYRLKLLSEEIGLNRPLTMYVARHSWASAARSKNIPISVISEGMGHDNEATTQIYLASLETSVVDNANKKIIGLL